MIKLITSKTEQGIFDELVKELKQIDQSDLTQNHIVIVPSRFSMSTEDLILKSLSTKGSFNTRVLSFERIANELEESRMEYLGQEGAVMILTKILFEHKDELVYFKKSISTIGFADELYKTIGKLKLSRITPEQFIQASENTGRFKAKNYEIGQIYKWYEEYVASRFLDPITRLSNLGDKINSEDRIKETSFYIVGYQDYTEQDYFLIEKLIQNAKDIFIGVLLNENPNLAHIYTNEQFKRIEKIIKDNSNDYKVIKPEYSLNARQEKLLENLFTTKKTKQQSIKEEIKVFEGSSIMDECMYVAKQIKESVERGERYKDTSIVCLSDSYIPYLETAGKLFDIPLYIDKRYLLSNHPLCIYLNELIDLKRYDMKQRDVLCFVKNYFFKEEYFNFETYVLKNNINRNLFLKPFDIKSDEYEEVERIRLRFEKIVKPILSLKDKCVANDYINALKDFIVNANIEKRLNELTKDLGEDSALGKVNTQIFRKINKLIELAQKFIGDMEISFNEFASIFLNGIAADSSSIIPLYLDSVFVGTDRNEYFESKNFIFLGCDSNSFPSISQDTNIINDDNIAALRACNVVFSPSNESSNRTSYINATQLVLKAKNRLIFTFNNLEGKKQSIVIDDIVRLFNNSDGKFVFDKLDGLNTYSISALKHLYYSYLGKPYRNEEEENIFKTIEELMINNKDDRDQLFTATIRDDLEIIPSTISVSEIESYFTCPYRRFVSYNLRAREMNKGSLDAIKWGDITHESLKLFVNKINDVTKENINSVVDNIFNTVIQKDEYYPYFNDPKNETYLRILHNRVRESCTKTFDSIEHSCFKPFNEEVEFKDGKNNEVIKITGNKKEISLRGIIDRVDLYNNNVNVIDYKTGSVSTAGFNIKKINNGTKLQLPIYLKAISKVLEKNPSGAFYMILNDKYIKEDENNENFKYEGFFVGDISIAKSIDSTISDNGSDYLYNVKTKDGSIKGNSKNLVLSQEDLDDLIEKSFKKAQEAVIALENNDIRLRPIDNDACGYCSYKNICMKTIEENEE